MTEVIAQRASDQLAAWYSRRPCLALMGEYSSGKSALLNALVGAPMLPTRVTATDLPAIWLTKGPELRLAGLTYDGQLVNLAPDALVAGRAMAFLCIRIESPTDILSQSDIIDTPGISDPRMTTTIVEAVIRHIDFAIWCSPMTQAWRQTEKAFWKQLPDRVKALSLLALTRADMLASREDVARVIRRCAMETAGAFSAVLPVSATLADAARAAADPAERLQLLAQSGISALQDRLAQVIDQAVAQCAKREKLADPAQTASQHPLRTKAPKAKKPAPARTSHAALRRIGSLTTALRKSSADHAPRARVLANLGRLQAALADATALPAEHRAVLLRAAGMPKETVPDPESAIRQIIDELDDFAETPWCALGI